MTTGVSVSVVVSSVAGSGAATSVAVGSSVTGTSVTSGVVSCVLITSVASFSGTVVGTCCATYKIHFHLIMSCSILIHRKQIELLF